MASTSTTSSTPLTLGSTKQSRNVTFLIPQIYRRNNSPSTNGESSSDEEARCSSPDTPLSSPEDVETRHSPVEALAIVMRDSTRGDKVGNHIYKKVYEAVRVYLHSKAGSPDIAELLKDIIPVEIAFLGAPDLVNFIVQEMQTVQSKNKKESMRPNPRFFYKSFHLLYRIWDFLKLLEYERGIRPNNGHPPLLEHVEYTNIRSLFIQAPIVLDIYVTEVKDLDADGKIEAKFIQLTHWYLYRTMMGGLTDERRAPVRLSNAIVSRIVKFFIQLPNYMVIDTIFCLSVFFQGGKSTLYPSSFLLLDRKLQESYLSFIPNAFTKESIFSALGAAMKANMEQHVPNTISIELHANVSLAAMQLYWDGVRSFSMSSACAGLAVSIAGALATGACVQGEHGKNRFKERLVQLFDHILLMCIKTLKDDKARGKFLSKLLPLFTTEGAMTAYIYYGRNGTYSSLTGIDGTTAAKLSPPLIAVMTDYLHTHNEKLREFRRLHAEVELSWECRSQVLTVLGCTAEIYPILNEVFENQARLHREVSTASRMVAKQEKGSRDNGDKVNVMGDWERICTCATHMLHLELRSSLVQVEEIPDVNVTGNVAVADDSSDLEYV